ncbi:MAG: GyrI-like domain-containing protein [Spirochaetes bacterium]|nr:GyrI-like domain-containing protein [Spirochaetota bacterium]
MLKKILIALAAVAAALTVLWVYYGGFASPAPIHRAEAGPFHVAYISHVGPYKKIGDVIKKLKKEIEAAGITDYRAGGLYYDDPKIAGESRCRGEAIAVLKPEQLEKLKGHPVLKTKTIERREYLQTVFPFRGMVSVMAGLMKVYPMFDKYFKENQLAPYVYREKDFEDEYGIEIYGPEKIFYYMTFKK